MIEVSNHLRNAKYAGSIAILRRWLDPYILFKELCDDVQHLKDLSQDHVNLLNFNLSMDVTSL